MTELATLRQILRQHTRANEPRDMARLRALAGLDALERQQIVATAVDLVRSVRESSQPSVMEAFLVEYGLSTGEGVALMCLAEALLRVPDAVTLDELIQDKIVPHDWGSHIGDSGSILVNASTWALLLTGRMLEDEDEAGIVGALHGALRRMGEPLIRAAVASAMRELGSQFVLGRDIGEAVRRGESMLAKGYTYSYDMLGEAARTEADAARYLAAYASAIKSLATDVVSTDIRFNPGISVKLSALHPRYEQLQKAQMLPELIRRTAQLARAACGAHLGFNIDAEEAERLDVSLDLVEALLRDPALEGWQGLGVVVQAYAPRAEFVIDWLHALAGRLQRRIMVRLVKGAYWDSEIKQAQTLGLDGFAVYTRKTHTDVSYIACARKLLNLRAYLYPQFATHNAHTVAAVVHMAGEDRDGFEFQRLHGMGEALHDIVREREGTRCRIYAPVGEHRDLLAYLVRRLLENGANSSFVHQIVDTNVAPEQIGSDPFTQLDLHGAEPHPGIRHPSRLYGAARLNSHGFDLGDPLELEAILKQRSRFQKPYRWSAAPIIAWPSGDDRPWAGQAVPIRQIFNPADTTDLVGEVCEAGVEDIAHALAAATDASNAWSARSVSDRAAILRRAAQLFESNWAEVFALCAREAGKTLSDAIAELREAVDFLRYYSSVADEGLEHTRPRGVIVCISPWNFPLAIFTGQIAAALVSGNVVLAKPAEQTPLIAARAVAWLHEAGVPIEALQLLPGNGPDVGEPLVADPRIGGVCFTGSFAVAKLIDKRLARSRPDAMLIAETGGINAMLVDSTALPEQAVRDILASAFQSAGQRCSALRVLYVQREMEARLLQMLKGAMQTLKVGDPWQIDTDVGPVIDQTSQTHIISYCTKAAASGRLIESIEPNHEMATVAGRFVRPTLIRVSDISEMTEEIFGPVLHVACFDSQHIRTVIEEINTHGYGLTLGLHSRIDARVQAVVESARVGNLYINRNQIGAVVGVQPFGGEGLSGTGPKAGGPHYLRRFRRWYEVPEQTPDNGVCSAPGPEIFPDFLTQALARLVPGEWATRKDRVGILRTALRGRAAQAMSAAAALDCGPIDLPGPTGESNRLILAPRGAVLCLGPGPEQVLEQTVQALCAGNCVLAVTPGAESALAPLVLEGLPVEAIDGLVNAQCLTDLPVALVAGMDQISERRQALSNRLGPIVALVFERIDPAAYTVERTVSIDTTAAGGNATLLASV